MAKDLGGPGGQGFLRHIQDKHGLANDCLKLRPPVRVFRHLMPEHQGETEELGKPVRRCPLDRPAQSQTETFNPWSIVNLVFHHLAQQGLHPQLGITGDPGVPAAELLRALGIEPALEGNQQDSLAVRNHLAEIRKAFFGES